MENKKEITKENEFESQIVSKFISDLRKGTSVLQKDYSKPFYPVNVASGNILEGFDAIRVAQELQDRNKKSNLVITHNQMEDKKMMVKYGVKALTCLAVRNNSAYYKEDDKEVIEGKAQKGEHKMNPDGSYVKDTYQSWVYPAEDVFAKNFIYKKDENGKTLKYENDVYADKQTYDKDTVLKRGEKEELHKAGTPVLLHFKDSGQLEKVVPNENEPLLKNLNSNLPKLSAANAVPLYQRKDNSAKEILIEGLTKGMRAMMNGGSGWNPDKAEIDLIEKEFKSHSRQFQGIARTAWARAIGDPKKVQEIDDAVLSKQQKKTEVKENVNVASKKHGRS